MQEPIQLSFRGIKPSERVSDYVHKKAEKLDALFPRAGACHVALEAPPGHHRHGGSYRVRVELTVPGQKLVAGSHEGAAYGHEDLYGAIDDAFAEAGRILKKHAERLRESRRPAPP